MTTDEVDIRAFARAAAGLQLFGPASDEYRSATAPANSSVRQAPAAVIRPRSAQDVAAAVTAARELDANLAVQSTGHGAGRHIGAESILIDTRELAEVFVDPDASLATVGAGALWGDVQAAAEHHGLLGLSGSSPRVGVSGYTFGGGVGWLTRPFGLASASLRSVTYVDGTGRIGRAADDAVDPRDRGAMWAFRGGAPTGIATEITLRLFPVEDLWAGYLLWPAQDADRLIRTWASALGSVSTAVTSDLALLRLPPQGPFPAPLLDTTVVHMSFASVDGEAGLRTLRDAMRAEATPLTDTTGPSDAARLATIHLDPPAAEPARGAGYWLSADALDFATDVLHSARVGARDGLQMAELRHVGASGVGAHGAMTTPPGPLLLHAVGRAAPARQRQVTERALRRVRDVAAPAVVRSAVSFTDGGPNPLDAYDTAQSEQLNRLADTLDPSHVFRFERTPVRAGVS